MRLQQPRSAPSFASLLGPGPTEGPACWLSLVVGGVPMQACRWHRTRRRGRRPYSVAARHAPAHRAEEPEAQEYIALRILDQGRASTVGAVRAGKSR
ncbi:hypothetical protein PsYK624_108950 [Phanerochaete sordida]|uniref:Uncharacterized protein n=1 Tax=Phanerochaete sordida TaxID=48140 RepID=A0A9P3GI53_9APHY|nr:hypothetical protein PsYK624_108950 [Phanerochaete sordida]